MELWKGIIVLMFFLGLGVVWINLAVGIALLVTSIAVLMISAIWNTSGSMSDWVEEHK